MLDIGKIDEIKVIDAGSGRSFCTSIIRAHTYSHIRIYSSEQTRILDDGKEWKASLSTCISTEYTFSRSVLRGCSYILIIRVNLIVGIICSVLGKRFISFPILFLTVVVRVPDNYLAHKRFNGSAFNRWSKEGPILMLLATIGFSCMQLHLCSDETRIFLINISP